MKLRDNPCTTCGWKYPGFHVCVDLSKPIDPRIVRKHNQKYAAMHTPAHKARLAEGLNARWERYREETADRDAALVERYRDSSISIKAVAAEFGIAYQTARNALLRAEMRGEVTIRPQGSNARWQNARM